jgi:polyisoprenoid-binding protein YceI
MRSSIAAVLSLLAAAGNAGERHYAVDAGHSAITIHVGKAGLFSFAGHEHQVLAPRLSGEVQLDEQEIGRSSVSVTVDATALRVSGEGEPPEDVPKVQERMVGAELLDVVRFPQVSFRSTRVEGRETAPGHRELKLTGELTVHGVARTISVPVVVETAGERLTATGKLVVRHRDHGLTPVSVAGVVKVKDEIAIDFRIEALARP